MNISIKLQVLVQRICAKAEFRSVAHQRSCLHSSSSIIDINVISGQKLQYYFLKRPHFSLNHIMSCWNCGTSFYDSVKFCSKCHTILPQDKSLNYFQIIGIQEQFNVDKEQLTALFRKLQSIFHPDKFSVKSKEEQILAGEHSSVINNAYRTLRHPVKRAEYMLELNGQPLEEGEITADSDFLMEILEVNERLANAEDKETILEIGLVNNQIMEKLVSQANYHFTTKDIKSAREVVAQMKYYNNIYEKVRNQELKYNIFH